MVRSTGARGARRGTCDVLDYGAASGGGSLLLARRGRPSRAGCAVRLPACAGSRECWDFRPGRGHRELCLPVGHGCNRRRGQRLGRPHCPACSGRPAGRNAGRGRVVGLRQRRRHIGRGRLDLGPDNDAGQYGDGTTSDHAGAARLEVPGLSGIVQISTWRGVFLAVDANGQVWQWGGYNSATGPVTLTPAKIPGLSSVKSVALGAAFNGRTDPAGGLALLDDGTVDASATAATEPGPSLQSPG